MYRRILLLALLATADMGQVKAAGIAESRMESRIELASRHRAGGRAEAALELLAPYAEMVAGNLSGTRFEGYLEAARCELDLEKPRSAYKLLDYAKRHAVGIPGVRVRVVYADIVEAVPDIPKTIAYVKDAINYGDNTFRRRKIKGESDSDPGKLEAVKPGHERWPPLRKGLLKRLARLERQLRIDRWGLDYVMYLEAQQARRAGDPQSRDFTGLKSIYPRAEEMPPSSRADYSWALDNYRAITKAFPESVFAEAAGLCEGICLGKLGKASEAEQSLKRFIDRAPGGLYRGEAWEVMGNLHLQWNWDLKKAKACYQEAVTWCRRVRGRAEAAAIYAVPEACREPAQAPAAWQRMVKGVVEAVRPEPGAIINRLTADWYLDQLEERCLFSLGFIFAVEEDWDKAGSVFGEAAAMDPLLQEAERQGYLNCMRRLQSACEKKAFVGTAEEAMAISGKQRTAVMWADLMYLRRQFRQASSWYDRLFQASCARKDHEVMARAGLGLMLVAMQRGDAKGARSVCERIIKACPKAKASPYVFFLCGHTFGPDDDGSYATAIGWYQRSYQRYPRSRIAEMARFYEIFKGERDDPEALRGMIRRFERDFPRSDYLVPLRECLGQALNPPNGQRQG